MMYIVLFSHRNVRLPSVACSQKQVDETWIPAPFFCTTIGLIVFFTCPYAYFDVLPHAGLGTENDIALRNELLAMSVSQLRRRAMAANIPDDDLAEVLNQLQDDTAPLADLILNTECSSHRKALVALQTMTIAELVDKASAVGVDDEALDAALDNVVDIHNALVCCIVGTLDTDGDGEVGKDELAAMENPLQDAQPTTV